MKVQRFIEARVCIEIYKDVVMDIQYIDKTDQWHLQSELLNLSRHFLQKNANFQYFWAQNGGPQV